MPFRSHLLVANAGVSWGRGGSPPQASQSRHSKPTVQPDPWIFWPALRKCLNGSRPRGSTPSRTLLIIPHLCTPVCCTTQFNDQQRAVASRSRRVVSSSNNKHMFMEKKKGGYPLASKVAFVEGGTEVVVSPVLLSAVCPFQRVLPTAAQAQRCLTVICTSTRNCAASGWPDRPGRKRDPVPVPSAPPLSPPLAPARSTGAFLPTHPPSISIKPSHPHNPSQARVTRFSRSLISSIVQQYIHHSLHKQSQSQTGCSSQQPLYASTTPDFDTVTGAPTCRQRRV